MAVNLGSAYAEIGLDVSGLESAARSAQSSIGRISDSLKNAGSSISSFGVGFTAGISAPLGVVAKASIGAASDMAETQSKIGVVFGESADAIRAFAETSAKSLGQSTQAALDAAAIFATFGKGAGLSGDDLVGFSSQLTTLASDLASFSNTSPEQAIEAIGAALRGESEPIRSYGVLLDDATLRARALALGIYDGAGALTQQQRVLAAQAEIIAQTGDAQGDFARTSEGLANQQRILSARLENVKVTLGNALLPVALQVTRIFQGIVTVVQGLAERFASADKRVQNISIAIGAVAIAAGPLLIALGAIISAVGTVLPVLSAVAGFLASPMVLAIGAVVAGLVLLVRQVGGIEVAFSAVKGFATSAASSIRSLLGSGITAFFDGLANAQSKLPSLKTAFDGLVTSLGRLLSALAPVASAIAGLVGGAVVAGLNSLLTIVGTGLPVAADILRVAINGLSVVFSAVAGGITSTVESVSLFIDGIRSGQGIVASLSDALGVNLIGAIETVKGVLSSFSATMSSLFGVAIAAVRKSFDELTNGSFPSLASSFAGLGNALTPLRDAFVTAFQLIGSAVQSLTEKIQPAIGIAVQAFQTAGLAIGSAVAGIVAVIGGVLVSSINGLVSAIAVAMPYIVSIITGAINVVTGIINSFAAVIGIVRGAITGDTQLIAQSWVALKESVKTTLAELFSIVQTVFITVVDVGKTLISGFVTSLLDYFDTLITGVTGKGSDLQGAIVGILTSAKNAAVGIASSFVEIGQQIINGIVSAISGGAGAIVGAITSAINSAISAAKAALGIQSPSKVMIKMFGQVVDGMVIGIERNESAIVGAANKLAKSVTSAMSVAPVIIPSVASASAVGGQLASVARDGELNLLTPNALVSAQQGGGSLNISLSVDARGGGANVKGAVIVAVKEALKEAGVRTDLVKRMKQ